MCYVLVTNSLLFFRPVVMCIMKHLPKIKSEYLDAILNDKELYKEAAVEVKQQIWQDNQVMLGCGRSEAADLARQPGKAWLRSK